MKLQVFFLLVFCVGTISLSGSFATIPNCEVLAYTTFCEVRGDKIVTTDSLILRINNRSGEEYTDISLPYDKNNPLTDLEGWIEDRNGHIIRRLRNQDVVDVSAITDYTLYQDSRIKRFSLKHNDYPYKVGITYKTSSRQFLDIARWIPVIGLDVPTRQATLRIMAPENYQMKIMAMQAEEMKPVKVSGTIWRTWKAAYDGSLRTEPFSPSPAFILPNVRIAPENFFYGEPGSITSWQTFGNWQYRLMEGMEVLPDKEKDRISEIARSCNDRKEIVKALYHYMQDNTHYVNVTIDIGGLKPYPASYVSVNHYGDCKALTNYMKAILACAGIDSKYTIVYAGEQPGILRRDLPGQQFNHAILTVPLGNDTIWLENTDNTSPFGYLGTFTQNREALLIDENQSRIIRLPELQEMDVIGGSRFVFILKKDGLADVSIRSVRRGSEFEYLSQLQSNYNINFQNEQIHEMVPFSNFELNDWKIIRPNRDATEINVVFDLQVQNVLRNAGEDYYFSIVPAEIPDPGLPSNRHFPVSIPYPVACSDTMFYVLPEGTTQVTLPENSSINNEFGTYHLTFSHNPGTVTIIRKFLLRPGYYSLQEYPGLYSFLNKIRNEEKRKILIQYK